MVLKALGAEPPDLRPPAAAARPRRQEALQAPRRGVGPGAARRRLPARGGAQLHRAARLGPRRRDHLPHHRPADRGLLARAGVEVPGGVRRAEAALDERALPARAGDRGAGRRGSSSCWTATAWSRPWRWRRRRCRRWPTSGRSRAFWWSASPPTRRPGRKVMREGAGERLAAVARGAGSARDLRPGGGRGRPEGARGAARREAQGGLPAAPCGDRGHARLTRASSSRWPRWDVKRPLHASIALSSAFAQRPDGARPRLRPPS